MKKLLFILLFVFVFSSPAHASYTLPYPGIMPGNRLYVIGELFDKLKGFLAFGDFASFSHTLSQSDKYLVEAKTLFEYKQYLLGAYSLEKSNKQIILAREALDNAKDQKKDISEKEKILSSAIQKHNLILKELKSKLPDEFKWVDEDSPPVQININSDIQTAINVRSNL